MPDVADRIASTLTGMTWAYSISSDSLTSHSGPRRCSFTQAHVQSRRLGVSFANGRAEGADMSLLHEPHNPTGCKKSMLELEYIIST